MSFIDLAKARYSSRKYLNIPIKEETIIQVLESARISPSAANYQPCIFYVINKPENLQKINDLYLREWLKDAPVIIIACADHNSSWKRSDGKDHADIDIAIAVDH